MTRFDSNFMLRLPLLFVIRDAARAAVESMRHPMSLVNRDHLP
ncbi:hypothetical protein [Variovorax sp. UC122_21]